MMVAVVVPCVQSIDNSCDKRSNGFVGGDPKAQPTTAGKTDRSIDASDFGVKKGFGRYPRIIDDGRTYRQPHPGILQRYSRNEVASGEEI